MYTKNEVAVAEASIKLEQALDNYFVGTCTFLTVFDETPRQAIAAFQQRPATFGIPRSTINRLRLHELEDEICNLASLIERLTPREAK